jgi:hypothetical protein
MDEMDEIEGMVHRKEQSVGGQASKNTAPHCDGFPGCDRDVTRDLKY